MAKLFTTAPGWQLPKAPGRGQIVTKRQLCPMLRSGGRGGGCGCWTAVTTSRMETQDGGWGDAGLRGRRAAGSVPTRLVSKLKRPADFGTTTCPT